MIDNRLFGADVRKIDGPIPEWHGKWGVYHPTLGILVAVCDTEDEARHFVAVLESMDMRTDRA